MTWASLTTLEEWRSPSAHDIFLHSRLKVAPEKNPLEDVWITAFVLFVYHTKYLTLLAQQ